MDRLIERVAVDELERADLQARVRVLSRECGCAMGGAFFGMAFVLALVYVTVISALGVRTAILSAIVVLVATSLGKLTGVLLARLKLAALQRSLSRRVQQPISGHVHVH